MKETPLTLAIDKALDIKIKAIERIVEEFIDPLSEVGNPEKLIGKPYEEWTPQDLSVLSKIYGTSEPNLLSNLIFRKKFEEVKRMEEEELNG